MHEVVLTSHEQNASIEVLTLVARDTKFQARKQRAKRRSGVASIFYFHDQIYVALVHRVGSPIISNILTLTTLNSVQFQAFRNTNAERITFPLEFFFKLHRFFIILLLPKALTNMAA